MKIDGKKVIYKGIFLDEESSEFLYRFSQLAEGHLPIEVNDLHITFEFKPKSIFPEEWHGEEIEMLVTGYGNNGRVEGFRVELPDYLHVHYNNEAIPHITIAKIEEAKAVETGYIHFHDIEPIKIWGYLGYFIGRGVTYNYDHN